MAQINVTNDERTCPFCGSNRRTERYSDVSNFLIEIICRVCRQHYQWGDTREVYRSQGRLKNVEVENE